MKLYQTIINNVKLHFSVHSISEVLQCQGCCCHRLGRSDKTCHVTVTIRQGFFHYQRRSATSLRQLPLDNGFFIINGQNEQLHQFYNVLIQLCKPKVKLLEKID